MHKFKFVLFLLPIILLSPANAQAAQWTIMVYMNGNNDLEEDTLKNLDQMASVGSTAEVNVVVQIARKSKQNVVRGRVAKTDPRFSYPYDDLDVSLGNIDMGQPDTLYNFLKWGTQNYPAKRYAVIVWGHGAGWRNIVDQRSQTTADDRTPGDARSVASDTSYDDAYDDAAAGSPLRGVSWDDLHTDKQGHSHYLFNKDVQNVLERIVRDKVLSPPNESKFELVAFDACLMGMVETAYSLRNSASFMVGSEETIPSIGFPYDLWLGTLTEDPDADGAKLARFMIDAYAKNYTLDTADTSEHTFDPKLTTLSAVRMDKLDTLVKSISQLGDGLSTEIPSNVAKVRALRDKCQEYGKERDATISAFHHVDLNCIASAFSSGFSNLPAVKSFADQVIQDLNSVVIANYVGEHSKVFGGGGLSVYFADSKSAYNKDPYALKGYDKNNMNHPVDFVKNEHWADFLHKYWSYVNE
jgi:hypothetical protein